MFRIAPAREEDAPLILRLIKGLAEYERLSHEVVTSEDDLRRWLFGPKPVAEAVIAYVGDERHPAGDWTPAGFALFFHTFSTFRGRPGLYLEDLFVVPEWRGHGLGRQLLTHLARIAVERGCARMEWAVLDWNEPAIGFYKKVGAQLMDEWRICRLTSNSLAQLAASTGGPVGLT